MEIVEVFLERDRVLHLSRRWGTHFHLELSLDVSWELVLGDEHQATSLAWLWGCCGLDLDHAHAFLFHWVTAEQDAHKLKL